MGNGELDWQRQARWATVSAEHDQRACCFACVRREIIHFRTVNAAGKISRVSKGSTSTCPVRSQRHIVIRSVRRSA